MEAGFEPVASHCVAVRATGAEIELLDRGCQAVRAVSLDEQVRVGVGPEYFVYRGVEIAGDPHHRHIGVDLDGRLLWVVVIFVVLSWVARRVSWWVCRAASRWTVRRCASREWLTSPAPSRTFRCKDTACNVTS